jgi:DNA-binding response OmpR family regulator
MDNRGTVLLVEDNEALNAANARALKLYGYTVSSALTLAEARLRLGEIEPDVILLDIMLPDGNGFDFCKEIRGKTGAHIIFLTAKSEQSDMVDGLLTGGDDYITKPFHPEELMARLTAAMRRRGMDKAPLQKITKGNLTLDIIAGQALIDGADMGLQPKEFALLLLFAQNENQIISAETIYEKIWGQSMTGDKNAVQAAVSRLRKKIEPAGYDIFATRVKGYTFEKN